MKLEVNKQRMEEIVGNDTETLKLLLGMLIDTFKRTIEKMHTSTGDSAEDKKIWHDANHELKGAAMNLGFNELAEFCKIAEQEDRTTEQKKSDIQIYIDCQKQIESLI